MAVNVRDTWQLLAMAPPSSRLHFENVTLMEIFKNIWVSKIFNIEKKCLNGSIHFGSLQNNMRKGRVPSLGSFLLQKYPRTYIYFISRCFVTLKLQLSGPQNVILAWILWIQIRTHYTISQCQAYKNIKNAELSENIFISYQRVFCVFQNASQKTEKSDISLDLQNTNRAHFKNFTAGAISWFNLYLESSLPELNNLKYQTNKTIKKQRTKECISKEN